MRWLFLILVLAFAPATASAQVLSDRPAAVSIVVYPELSAWQGYGLVMVTERRTVDLPAGPVRVSFRGVADGIVPQTAAIEGLAQGVKEQNFDYQLLSPGSLIYASEGRTVRVTRTNRATGAQLEERARVVASASGATLDYGDGRYEALNCSGLPEKIAFDDLPAGFSDKPTLSVDVVSPRAGRVEVMLSYLAVGVSWSSNYVARIRPDGRTLDLSNWITIKNTSATTFPDAPVQVIAGTLERRPNDTQPVRASARYFYPFCWQINSGRTVEQIIATAGFISGTMEDAAMEVEAIMVTGRRLPAPAAPMLRAREVEAEDLGDYKLYSLPEKTTLAAYQTKQLMMFDRKGVAFDRVYRVELAAPMHSDLEGKPIPASIIAELENKRADGLGLPLPAGTVALFEPSEGGRPFFVGEDRVRDIPLDLPFEFRIGESVQVQARARRTDTAVEGKIRWARMEVTLTNATNRPVDIQVRELAQPARVTEQSAPHVMKYGSPQWTVRVPPNQSQVLTYRLEWALDALTRPR